MKYTQADKDVKQRLSVLKTKWNCRLIQKFCPFSSEVLKVIFLLDFMSHFIVVMTDIVVYLIFSNIKDGALCDNS